MRRKHSEVTDPGEIERILSMTNIGRMATIGQDGYPYITPVNFVSMDGNIYFTMFYCSFDFFITMISGVKSWTISERIRGCVSRSTFRFLTSTGHWTPRGPPATCISIIIV